ncbi:hypothetical protein [Sphaerimonospora thailandensis]|uniref:Uncharacterized protein n=1 Tax=Sphaerimonospora thailandensis TaxID=795644 RepID=A0A8J3R4Y0_9ACTN|nr:hypothetical protein [Sphaerimonospora thailandensis]GIH68039.1 hypothetical protein Mth01_02920 [Sphaerimonospora thailandensis]
MRVEGGADATADALLKELRALLRSGLPVRPELCGLTLLGLRGVKARALRPGDPESRARALDGLLREQLDRFENAELAPAARLLFGAETTTSGATLMTRREAAAQVCGYEKHHFRKRIEPKVLDLVAWQLRRDSEEFTTRHATAPELHAASGPLVLPADVFAWEAAEHQHAMAALWGAVYLLRAELLTVARLISMEASESEVDQAAMVALWRHALVLEAAARYRAAYGAALLHAAADLGPQEIATYAGWTPPLTPIQELLLAELADPAEGLADFSARLGAAADGAELAGAWRRALSSRPPKQQGGPEKEGDMP